LTSLKSEKREEEMRIPKILRASAVLLGVVGWAGCSSPTSATSLGVDLTASPNPSTAVPSNGVFYTIKGDDTHPDKVIEYPYSTSFVVNIQESEGVALEITAVNLRVQQASGGIVIAPSGGDVEHYQFNSSASGNTLSAKGHGSVGFQVWYDLPNKGKEALVTVSLSFKEQSQGSNDVIDSFSDTLDVKIAP
jgi:hypothetical protein